METEHNESCGQQLLLGKSGAYSDEMMSRNRSVDHQESKIIEVL